MMGEYLCVILVVYAMFYKKHQPHATILWAVFLIDRLLLTIQVYDMFRPGYASIYFINSPNYEKILYTSKIHTFCTKLVTFLYFLY